jgi:hypothetical protein
MKTKTGQANIHGTAKSVHSEPVPATQSTGKGLVHKPSSLPVEPVHTKRIGRPKGSKNKSTLAKLASTPSLTPTAAKRELSAKIKQTFEKTLADASQLMVPEFDGGGTSEKAPKVSKESLERRVARRLNVLDRFLTDDKLLQLLQGSSLKEVGIYEGIMLDKSLVLQGQPTVIIGQNERSQIDEALPKLLAELRRRKLITTVSERKIEFTGEA